MKLPTKRSWIPLVYLVLLAAAIPWYWPATDIRQAFGLPYWAIASLTAVLATATFTAWVYLTNDED